MYVKRLIFRDNRWGMFLYIITVAFVREVHNEKDIFAQSFFVQTWAIGFQDDIFVDKRIEIYRMINLWVLMHTGTHIEEKRSEIGWLLCELDKFGKCIGLKIS